MHKRPTNETFSARFLAEAVQVIEKIDTRRIESLALGLAQTRRAGGRLFVLGVGGSAANAGHAVSDFRKICGFEAYAPTDNVSELTARTNDHGWENCLSGWLEVSRLASKDALLIFSVGGGSLEKRVSVNLIRAIDLAKRRRASVFAIVGRDGGYAARMADTCVIIPTVSQERVTPHTEGFSAVLFHLLVNHPLLQVTRKLSSRAIVLNGLEKRRPRQNSIVLRGH